MLVEVTTLYEQTVRDIPAMLRMLADDVEAGKYGEIAGVVSVVRRGDYSVEVFWYGEESYDVSIVALELGKQKLLRMAL